MEPKTQPAIKKVKIDEHIRNSRSQAGSGGTGRKPGRPPKNPQQSVGTPGPSNGITNSGSIPPSVSVQPTGHPSNGIPKNVPPAVTPQYDTTLEARGALEGLLAVAPLTFRVPEAMPEKGTIDLIAPAFKVFYDKRVKPLLDSNEYADIVAVAVALTPVFYNQYKVIKAALKLRELKNLSPQEDKKENHQKAPEPKPAAMPTSSVMSKGPLDRVNTITKPASVNPVAAPIHPPVIPTIPVNIIS